MRKAHLVEPERGAEGREQHQRERDGPEQRLAQRLGPGPVALVHPGHGVVLRCALRCALLPKEAVKDRDRGKAEQRGRDPDPSPVDPALGPDDADGQHRLRRHESQRRARQRPAPRPHEPAHHRHQRDEARHSLPEEPQRQDHERKQQGAGIERHRKARAREAGDDQRPQHAHADPVGEPARGKHQDRRGARRRHVGEAPAAVAEREPVAQLLAEGGDEEGLPEARQERQQRPGGKEARVGAQEGRERDGHGAPLRAAGRERQPRTDQEQRRGARAAVAPSGGCVGATRDWSRARPGRLGALQRPRLTSEGPGRPATSATNLPARPRRRDQST